MGKTSLRLPLWTLVLLGLTWVGALVSQSLVDLVDTLVIGTALVHAFQTDQLKEWREGYHPGWLWPIWIVLVAVGLYLNVGTENSKAWIEFLEWRWILTFLSFIYLIRHIPSFETEIPKLMPVFLVLNLIALYLYAQNPQERAGGVGNAIMAFSHSMGVFLCLWFFYFLEVIQTAWKNKKIQKPQILPILVFVTSAFLVLQTQTRGVWIAVVVGIGAASFVISKKLFLKFLGAVVLASVVFFALQPKLFERFISIGSTEHQSNTERMALWKGNWRIIQDNPVWGVGFQQNKHHLRKHYDEMGYPADQRISHAHNQYLQVWAGTGTLGLILFLFFCWTLIAQARRNLNITNVIHPGVFAALLCFMVGAVTEANFNIAKNRILFLLVAAIAVSMRFRSIKTTRS